MDRKTRIINAFEKKPVDRPPCGFWFHFSGEETEGKACIDAHMRHLEQSGIDMVKIMSDGYGYNLDIKIETAADWRRIKPQGKNTRYYQGQVDRVKMMNDALHGEVCTFYNIFSPFSTMRNCIPDAMINAHLKEDPEAVKAGLDALAEDVAQLAHDTIAEAGGTGIYLALQGAEKYRTTPEEYAECIAPSDLKVLGAANEASPYNIAHCCGWAGDANNVIVWKDYPAACFNWAIYIENMSLDEGRRLFGYKTVLGGFDNRRTGLLYNGTREEIEKFIKGCIEVMGTTGYIVGADCTVPATINKERLRWVSDALKAMAVC